MPEHDEDASPSYYETKAIRDAVGRTIARQVNVTPALVKAWRTLNDAKLDYNAAVHSAAAEALRPTRN